MRFLPRYIIKTVLRTHGTQSVYLLGFRRRGMFDRRPNDLISIRAQGSKESELSQKYLLLCVRKRHHRPAHVNELLHSSSYSFAPSHRKVKSHECSRCSLSSWYMQNLHPLAQPCCTKIVRSNYKMHHPHGRET